MFGAPRRNRTISPPPTFILGNGFTDRLREREAILEDRVGIEPTTRGLKARCSSSELPVHGACEGNRTLLNLIDSQACSPEHDTGKIWCFLQDSNLYNPLIWSNEV